jgi:hypothetical protein
MLPRSLCGGVAVAPDRAGGEGMAKHSKVRMIEIDAAGWGTLNVCVWRVTQDGERMRPYWATGVYPIRRISLASVLRAQRAQLRLVSPASDGEGGEG